jgi:1-deoxy-D-xylulose-5-phosphate reductoisomerase
MKKNIVILGSTGSIGRTTLNILKNETKKFRIVLLSTNKNIDKVFKQAKIFNVKNIIINDYLSYIKAKKKFHKSGINIYHSFLILDKLLNKKKIFYSMVSIVGLDGLNPALKLIKYSINIAIVNKESLISGWTLIKKKIKKYKTNFIPIDSEHFSISELLKETKEANLEKIYITASGGPFLNYSRKKLSKVSIKDTLRHPNWKMGKKISVDSATMMNKVFEVIEAKNIFGINYDKIKILTHPKSYIHTLIKFTNGQIKILAHEPDMKIPIHNSLYGNSKKIITNPLNFNIMNNLKLKSINVNNFPTINILKNLPSNNTLYETALISINDFLVYKFLEKKITFRKLILLLCKYSKSKHFTKYKKNIVKNINDIYKTRDYVYTKLNSFSL